MRTKHIFILTLSIMFGTGCHDYWTIQRSENFVNEKNKPQSIICIDPQVSFLIKEKNYDVESTQKLSGKLNENILKSAKKNKIELSIKELNSSADVGYYEKLLSLKQNLVEVNFNNYASANSLGNAAENRLSKNVFVYPPKVSQEFNSFSKQFGTKYFSFIRIVVGEGSFTYNHVIVDTDLSETVFSERKTINRKFNQDLCAQVIYDSFAALSKELKM